MSYYDGAKKLKASIDIAARALTDETALEAKEIYNKWEANIEYSINDRIRYNDVLYKCAQEHISQDNWTPNATPALWIAISVEIGTKENPIVAARGMEYILGKYYYDPETALIYQCVREGVLQYLPHELENIYFIVIE